MLRRNVAAGRLRFTTDGAEAAQFGLIQFIAVGTPSGEDGSADLQYVLAAARTLGRHMPEYRVVVTKSTVPVGTADRVQDVVAAELADRGIAIPFSVVSNPEFLKEGAAIDDFMRPDRIVVGSEDERAIALMRGVYDPIQRNHDRLIVMDARSAELTKYAANAMLATRISFMNELGNLAAALGADIEAVRQGIGSDPRIGRQFLYAGCGYGGSCFPKDLQALIRTARDDAGQTLKVLNAVEEVNLAQKQVLVGRILKRLGEVGVDPDRAECPLARRHFALWGLAFKPNTDDMRQAPSLDVISGLLAAGASITAYDPVSMPNARKLFSSEARLVFAADAMSALDGADALVIVTEWKEFRSPDFEVVKAHLKQPIIFDGRNLYNPRFVRQQGIEYFAIGR